MIYSRRQLLGAGAAAGLMATVAKAAGLSELRQVVADAKDPVPVPVTPLARPTVPAQPRVMVDPVIDPRLLARARAAFDQHRHALRHTDVVAIGDFSRPSRDPRFFLLETATGKVASHRVAHGRGSDPDHSGYVERFSNAMGSYATSHGGYVTGDFYQGKYGRSMKVRGLDDSNSNAEARAIVVHSAWYAEPQVVAEHGKLGRSEGCFALSYDSLQQVLARLGPGRFLFADKLGTA